MLAWEMFKKSVLLIADNLGPALRVSLVPYVILVCVTFYYAQDASFEWLVAAQAEMANLAPDDPRLMEVLTPPPGFMQAIFWSSLVQFLTYAWIAVGWHRYVLIGDGAQGWLPALRGGEILGYIGRTLLLGLLYAGVAFGLSLVLGLVMPLLIVPLATLAFFIVFYRAGIILPAGAIDKPLQLSAAWAATKGQTGTIVMLALMTFLLAIVLQIPGGIVSPEGVSVIGVLYGLVTGWVILMVGVGVLSTIYGHFVEGRRLD